LVNSTRNYLEKKVALRLDDKIAVSSKRFPLAAAKAHSAVVSGIPWDISRTTHPTAKNSTGLQAYICV
jgi:hypothetical protein